MAQEQRQPASPPAVEAPLLTLDDAVSALSNNRLVKNSALEGAEVRLPGEYSSQQTPAPVRIATLGGELMHSFDFTLTRARSARTTWVLSWATEQRSATRRDSPPVLHQPITQQYKIGLAIHATDLGGKLLVKMCVPSARKSPPRRTAYLIWSRPIGVERRAKRSAGRSAASHVAIRQKALLREMRMEVDARLESVRAVRSEGLLPNVTAPEPVAGTI